MVDAPSFLTTYSASIRDLMNRELAGARRRLPITLSTDQAWALDALEELTQRPSKMLRGCLAAAAYDSCSGKRMGQAGLQLAVALELMQTYLLIIDDVMDVSEQRRGQATLHETYRTFHHFGRHDANMSALTIGLYTQHVAAEVLANIDAPASELSQTQAIVHKNLEITGLGQLQDIASRWVDDSEGEFESGLYEQKTGYYTFVNPIEAGLVLAGGHDVIDDCRTFGLPAGVAYQMYNDSLGVFDSDIDDPSAAVPDDIRGRKYTVLVHSLVQTCSESERSELRGIFRKRSVSDTDALRIIQLMRQHHIDDINRQQIQAYVDQAKQAAMNAHSWDQLFARELGSIVDWLTGAMHSDLLK